MRAYSLSGATEKETLLQATGEGPDKFLQNVINGKKSSNERIVAVGVFHEVVPEAKEDSFGIKIGALRCRTSDFPLWMP